MSLPFNLREPLAKDTLDSGRQDFFINDQNLASLLSDFLSPYYKHAQDALSLAWIVPHGLGSRDVISTVRDTLGERVYPWRELPVSLTHVVLLFTRPERGSCLITLGKTGWTMPALSPIGNPTDGSWEDGAAGITSEDTISDAIDRINEVLAAMFPPPAGLSGSLDETVASFQSAIPAQGAGQNLSLLTAGNVFSNVTTTKTFSLRTPLSPAHQFAKADKGTLSILVDGVVIDSLDLEALFNEANRVGNQVIGPGHTGLNSLLRITAVGMYLNNPYYQKGSLSVDWETWLTVALVTGEIRNVKVRHNHTGADHDTAGSYHIFYDDGVTPTNVVPPVLIDDGSVNPKFLDGVMYYGVGFGLRAVVRFADAFKRSFQTNLFRLELPGATTVDLPFSHSTARFTRVLGTIGTGQFMDDTFTGGTIDDSKWSVLLGAPSQISDKLRLQDLVGGSGVNHQLATDNNVIRGSEWTVQVDLAKEAAPSTHGYQAGLYVYSLGLVDTNSIEFVYHHDSDTHNHLMEVYYTPATDVRTLFASATITDPGSDVNVLKIVNVTGDDYEFYYDLNGAGFVQVGGTLTFAGWDPVVEQQLKMALVARSDLDTDFPTFDVSFDNFLASAGRASSPDAVPDVADEAELFGYQIEIGTEEAYSADAVLTATPLGPRGGDPMQSASEGRLIHTMPNVSTATKEFFIDNRYRWPAGTWDTLTTGITLPGSVTGNWTDNIDLPADALLVFNSQLQYPAIDFSTGFLPVQTVDYSGSTGTRYYRRAFVPTTPKNSGTIFIPGVDLPFLTNVNITVEIKLPNVTGWLSLNSEFDSGTFTGIDGDGCRTTATGNSFGFSFGPFTTGVVTSPNKGRVLVRFTMPVESSETVQVQSGLEMIGWDT